MMCYLLASLPTILFLNLKVIAVTLKTRLFSVYRAILVIATLFNLVCLSRRCIDHIRSSALQAVSELRSVNTGGTFWLPIGIPIIQVAQTIRGIMTLSLVDIGVRNQQST